MSQGRELKMVRVCDGHGGCGNEYGRWRPRCPACGTLNDKPIETFNAPALKTSGRSTKERKDPEDACIVCRRSSCGTRRCPHCEELIHKPCLRMHAQDCARFQHERRQAELRLGGGAPS